MTINLFADRHYRGKETYFFLIVFERYAIIIIMNMKISSVEKTIIPVLRKYGVSQASLFGSIVRNEMKSRSDVDLLVKLPDNIHGFDYVSLRLNLQEELERKLKRKVDLVEFDYIKSSLKKYILTGQRPIMQSKV